MNEKKIQVDLRGSVPLKRYCGVVDIKIYFWSAIKVYIMRYFNSKVTLSQINYYHHYEAEVMWLFRLSFSKSKQDNWRTRKRTSTKLGRHGRGARGDLQEVINFCWWSGSASGFGITFWVSLLLWNIKGLDAGRPPACTLACFRAYARFCSAVSRNVGTYSAAA